MRLAHILGRRPTTASSRSDAKRGPDTEVLYFLERAKVFAVPPLLVQTISLGDKVLPTEHRVPRVLPRVS